MATHDYLYLMAGLAPLFLFCVGGLFMLYLACKGY